MGNNDPIPIVRRNLGQKLFAIFFCCFVLRRDQNLGVRIGLDELAGELFQHVVRNNVSRLADKTETLLFHTGRYHRRGFSGTDNVC